MSGRSAALRIECLGGFRLLAGERLLGRAITARQQHLLTYLALHRDAPVPRQQIAGQLWPDTRDAQALTNLRRELHHLRQTAPEVASAIDGGGRSIGWRPRVRPHFDVAEFDDAVERGLHGDRDALDRVRHLYRGDLLPSCDDEWIGMERDRLRRRFAESLGRLLEMLERERAFADAIDVAQRLLAIDPVSEAAWRSLIRCHGHRGQRATALHEYHRCAAVLKRELGVSPSAATRMTYREILDADDTGVMAAASVRPAIYPLVGRAAEWSTLLRSWQAAAAGEARLTIIRGEAGIGKTRLAEELADWCTARQVRVAVTRCYASGGRLAFSPIAVWLQSRSLETSLDALDPVWLTEVARLNPALLRQRPHLPSPEPRLEAWQRTRLFEAIVRAFEAAAPLLLVVDDLQWCDSDTLDWLQFLFRSNRDIRCLVVGTVRSEEERDNEALGVLLREVERAGGLTTISLGPLDRTATTLLAEAVTERPLDVDTGASLFQHSEGHPLFIVETGRMESSAAPAPSAALPPRMHALIESRLAQLSADARAIAEVAATIGRDFTFPVLAHVSDLEEGGVVRALDELWQRQIVRAHGHDLWDFSHDRIREVAYARVGPAQRRLLHRRIAQAIELVEGADQERVSAALALHLEQAGQFARAIEFFERGAHVALKVSAYEEAIRCGTRALSLLEQMPDGRERDEQELRLRTALAGSFTAARGYAAPVVEQNVERIAALGAGLGKVSLQSLWSEWTVRFVLGDLERAHQLAETALTLARADQSHLCDAHHAMGGTLASLGQFPAARQHFEAALASWNGRERWPSAHGSDLGVFTHAWFSHVLWLLGESDAASEHAERALTIAARLGHPYSQALAHAYTALTAQLQRDVATVRSRAETCIALCARYGFAYYGDWARVLLGWSLSQELRASDGIAMIEAALERLDTQRARTRRPYYLSLLAEAHVANGNPHRALEVIEQALAIASERHDTWWTAELYRSRGELQSAAAATASFQHAMQTARAQGSRALESKAALSLAPLSRPQPA